MYVYIYKCVPSEVFNNADYTFKIFSSKFASLYLSKLRAMLKKTNFSNSQTDVAQRARGIFCQSNALKNLFKYKHFLLEKNKIISLRLCGSSRTHLENSTYRHLERKKITLVLVWSLHNYSI